MVSPAHIPHQEIAYPTLLKRFINEGSPALPLKPGYEEIAMELAVQSQVGLRAALQRALIVEVSEVVNQALDPWWESQRTLSPPNLEGIAATLPSPETWLEFTLKETGYPKNAGALFASTQEDAGWAVHCVMMVARPGEPIFMPAAMGEYRLDEQGNIAAKPRLWTPGGEQVPENIHRLAITYLSALIQSLSWFSVKNIFLHPEPMEAEHARRMRRRCGEREGDYRYHTLWYRPLKKSKGLHQPVAQPLRDIMGRHLCRAHFSEYGERFGKGRLFGRFEGRFFVPAHLKGNEKNGVIDKTYRIAPPDDATPTA